MFIRRINNNYRKPKYTNKKKLLQVINLQELYKVLEAGLEPAQPLLAKGF